MRHLKTRNVVTVDTVQKERQRLERMIILQGAAEREAAHIEALEQELVEQQAKLARAEAMAPSTTHRLEIQNHAGTYLLELPREQLIREARGTIAEIERQIEEIETHGAPWLHDPTGQNAGPVPVPAAGEGSDAERISDAQRANYIEALHVERARYAADLEQATSDEARAQAEALVAGVDAELARVGELVA